ncbi:hephaestin-like [Argonauta hians]
MPGFNSRPVPVLVLGLMLSVILSQCCGSLAWWFNPRPAPVVTREYFIAAVEETWDYAPSGRDQVFSSTDSQRYLAQSANRIGRKYQKVVYKEFTDATYSQLKPKEPWMGLLGPVVRAEVGDTILIHFRNMASNQFSVHPHGVHYTKGNEGALYQDNTSGALKKDEHVQPGETYHYMWNITEEFAPSGHDTACISWVYHSHINTPMDTNSGLIGPLITCKKGTLRNDNSRIDGKKEFVLLAKTYDENMSFYSKLNQKKCGQPSLCEKLADDEDEGYMDSNQMRSFNGYVYGNGPPFVLNTDEEVIWYIIGMGNEAGIHGIQFSGQVVRVHGELFATVSATQASFKSALMRPQYPGRWLINCAVTEHYTDGMLAYLDVKPAPRVPNTQWQFPHNFPHNGDPRGPNSQWQIPVRPSNKYFYLTVEEHIWDYAPSGKNNLTGVDLADDPRTEGKFTSGAHRIGRRYKKASFFQYTNDHFTTKIPTPAHMGLLGPAIQVTEGDTVTVTLRNKAAKRPYSFLPHGVWFTKENEGVIYSNGTAMAGKKVAPGETKTFEFRVPFLGNTDPACKVFLYQSSVDHVKDLNSGLVGPLKICKRKWWRRRDTPRVPGLHLEFYLLFASFDENLSWYLDDNIRHYTTDPRGTDINDIDFIVSNIMDGINGLVYANLPGLDMSVGDQVSWFVMSFGNEVDVHAPYFHGHTFQQGSFREDTSNLIPAQSWALNMIINNPGEWLVEDRSRLHFLEGMRALYYVRPSRFNPNFGPSHNTRRYYIAAEEMRWDFAPKKRSIVTGNDLNSKDEDGHIYIRHDGCFIGSVYKKALFREYTDDKFNQRVVRDASEVHLGLLGPIIRAEVGDTIEVYFKNKASRPYSMLPHGLYYKNDEDGELYNKSNPHLAAKIAPNATFKYTWKVPATSGPTRNDPNCITWHYTSAVDPIRDVYSGLIGPIVICRPGILNNRQKRKDIDKEFVFLFWVVDEMRSWYFRDNVAYYTPCKHNITVDDDDIQESNLFHSINGRIYGNNEGMFINTGDRVAWYLMSYGGEKDVHTIHLHGQTFVNSAGRRQRSDVITLTPSTTRQVQFRATNPGTWFLHCHVNDHIVAGMETVYNIVEPPDHLIIRNRYPYFPDRR